MKHLVAFPLKGGGNMIVEVDEPESEGTVRAGRGDVIARAKETLEEALSNIMPATREVAEHLRSAGNRPDEIEITFGIKLNTAAGAIIASASAEANFNVTVRWAEQKEAVAPA